LSIYQLALGLLLAALVSWLGYRAGTLQRSGAYASILIGTLIFGFGGWRAAILILFFFVSSSIMTRFKADRKDALQRNYEKGGRRDAGQVLANGGVAALLVTLYALTQSSLWLVGFVGSMAVATADTWATEIGVLSPDRPCLILNGSVVPRGTSGGVTRLGYLATTLGALGIGALGLLLTGEPDIVIYGLVGGLVGATIDSLLGARLQAMYFCPVCEKDTESTPEHNCGAKTVFQRGWRWMNNDVVNFLATCTGAVTSVGLALL
jgi:uncharacterized protein (TIGR00297 family)